MQQSRQKLDERQNEELLAWLLNLWNQIEANYTRILIGFGIAIAVILIVVFVDHQQNQRTEAAHEALGDVYIALFEGRVSDAIAASQEVMATYEGEAAADEALMAVANLHFEEGRIAEARDYYQRYLQGNSAEGPLGYGAWVGLASCLESEGNFAQAAKQFADYAAQHSTSPFAPVALKEAGRCYELGSMPQQAIDVYQMIVKDYSEAPVARFATGQLNMMGMETN